VRVLTARRAFRVPALLGGLGFVGCVLACGLPLIGVAGLAGGVGALAGALEPVSLGLLGAGIGLGLFALCRRLGRARKVV
jgi:hypothetical protein